MLIFFFGLFYTSITIGAAEYLQKEKGYGFFKSFLEGTNWPFWIGVRLARIYYKSLDN